jgi:hypothetical protein
MWQQVAAALLLLPLLHQAASLVPLLLLQTIVAPEPSRPPPSVPVLRSVQRWRAVLLGVV